MNYYSLDKTIKKSISFYGTEIKNVANKGFFYLFTSQGLILIVAFVSQFFVAGFLDPAYLGRIKIMQAYLNLATLICGLGFNTSLLKLASEKIGEDKKRQLYQVSFFVTIVSFVFLYFILWLLSAYGLISTDKEIAKIFPFYALFLLPISLQSIQMAYLQARKEIRRMAKLQLIVKSISVILIVVITYIYKFNGYIVSVVCTGFLGMIFFELVINNRLYLKINLKSYKVIIKEMWTLASYALLANIIGLLANTMDVYIINYLVQDRTEVGYYLFAITILSVYQLLPSTIQQVAFPFFSEKSSNFKKWYESYNKYNRLNHILVILVVLSGVILLPFLLKITFLGKYDRSIYYFLFLNIAWIFKNANMIKGTAIMGYGRFDVNLFSSLIILALSTPVIYVMIKNFALNGAIVGMIVSGVLTYLISSLIFKKFKNKLKNGI